MFIFNKYYDIWSFVQTLNFARPKKGCEFVWMQFMLSTKLMSVNWELHDLSSCMRGHHILHQWANDHITERTEEYIKYKADSDESWFRTIFIVYKTEKAFHNLFQFDHWTIHFQKIK